jgi:hypothetical protein
MIRRDGLGCVSLVKGIQQLQRSLEAMLQDFLIVVRCLSLVATAMCTVLPLCAQKLVPAGEARVSWEYAGTRVPLWSGGFLVPIENNGLDAPALHFIGDTGVEAQPLVFSIPGASSTLIDGVARGSDGTWVVCGRAHDREGKGGGFISWLSPDRQNVTTIRSYPYNAEEITIAPDGTTWTQGIEVVSGNDWVGSDHGVIRRFDKSGKLMGQYIPRNSIPEVSLGLQEGKLATNKDRVGWYVNHSHEYFELTYDGDKVSRPVSYPGIAPRVEPPSAWITGMAMMDNGDVYISAQRRDELPVDQLYRLDRVKRTWIPVPAPTFPDGTPNNGPLILGGDGERLALFGGPQSVLFARVGD